MQKAAARSAMLTGVPCTAQPQAPPAQPQGPHTRPQPSLGRRPACLRRRGSARRPHACKERDGSINMS